MCFQFLHTAAAAFYYMDIKIKTKGMSSLVFLLIALTPLPACINNNQRGRLNIYEAYMALVRIHSSLSVYGLLLGTKCLAAVPVSVTADGSLLRVCSGCQELH